MPPSMRLSRVKTPRYLGDHWQGADPTAHIPALVDGVITKPVVLPLTRLSGSLVYPVLDRDQLCPRAEKTGRALDIALVSVSPPARALRDLLQLRAYGHLFVLLPPAYRARFFDVAELDLRGIGVAAALNRNDVERLVASAGIPSGLALNDWWRSEREGQLRALAEA